MASMSTTRKAAGSGTGTGTASDGGSSTAYYHSATSSVGMGHGKDSDRETTGDPAIVHHSSSPSTGHGREAMDTRTRPPSEDVSGPGTPIEADSNSPEDSSDPPSSSEEEELAAVTPGKGEEGETSASHTRQQGRRVQLAASDSHSDSGGPARFDSARSDYFTRHPDPDYSLRRSSRQPYHAPPTTGSATDSSASADRPSQSRHHESHSRHNHNRGETSTSGVAASTSEEFNRSGGSGLFSPALSTATTLSAGVSVGPTMGGGERIFPIRSVVAPQSSRQNQQHQGQVQSYSTSHPRPASEAGSSKSRDGTYAASASGKSISYISSQGTANQYRPPPPPPSQYLQQHQQHQHHQHTSDTTSSPPFRHFSYSQPQSLGQAADQFPESGADYTRRSPMAEDTSDFSFPQLSSSKPLYRRYDSSTSGQGSDPTILTSSYRTASRYSDDSDPTARKGDTTNSTAPSTAQSRNARSSYSSSQTGGYRSNRRRPGLESRPSESSKFSGEGFLHKDKNVDDNKEGVDPTGDIIQRSKQLYDAGETEAGPSIDSGGLGSLDTHGDRVYVTVRFEHQETEEGHAILTGRKGELFKCEDEPIHIPGAIQDYGVLIAVEQGDDGNLVVHQVSENSGALLGLPPKLLFSLKSLTEVLDEDNADALLEAIENLEETEIDDPDGTGVPIGGTVDPSSSLAALNNFQLSGQGAPGTGMDGDDSDSRLEWTCWCAVHKPNIKDRPKLVVIEFELENDIMNPIMRDRTAEEIEEDKAREQSRSLFGERPSERPASGPDGPPITTLPGLGGADGETPDPGAAASSLPGMQGQGGNNGSSSAAATSSGVEGDNAPTHDVSGEPVTPGDEGLGGAATQDEIDSSTKSRVKPIRALRRLRKAKGAPGGGDVMKLFSVLGQINDELSKAEDLQTSLEIAAGVVAEITGFHRVMIYQFDERWNGQVVAELVDYKQTRDLYRGLHFPASDIPAQARELYKVNKVRLLYDRDQPTARIVCRSLKELETPLDLTHSHLRAMSPIHIKYLANMGVRASMSISIMAFGQLWGLVSCHTYGRYGQRVSFPGRQLCRILGDSISRNIERLSYAQRLQSRKLINTIPTNSNPGGYIIAKAEDLLALFDAEFGVLSIGDEAKILGNIDNSQEVLAVLEYLRVKQFDSVQATLNLTADFPDLDYPAGFHNIAGMLMVPLARAGRDFIAFFRRGQLEHVHWAGNPYDKVMRDNARNNKSLLEPRKSFKIWSETVVGRSRAWSDENLETAAVLRLVYGKFIEVWRQREAALTSSRLTTLLLSNASHEVRTPLNHIINYLEMALEGPLDDDTRESLIRSHSASRALVHVINDLLDLTRTETGQQFFLQDPLDLGGTIEEAVAIHRMEAERAGVAFEIIENPSGTPQTLLGDRGKIRQIVANVTANAVKHTKEGKVTIEWGELPKEVEDPAENSPDTIKIGIAISDTGVGIPEHQLEAMFRTFEQVEMESESVINQSSSGHLGLGLAVVARIVSQLGGQLRVESKVGQGSKFTFVLHFRLPGSDDLSRRASIGSTSSRQTRASQGPGEVSLQSSTLQKPRTTGTGSAGSRATKRTGSSLKSRGQISNKSRHSEIDSLVEAISSHPGSHEAASASAGATGVMASPLRPRKAGEVNIEDSGTPLRSLKMDENDMNTSPTIGGPGSGAGTGFSGGTGTATGRPKIGRHRTSHVSTNPAYATTSAQPSGNNTRQRSSSYSEISPSSPAQADPLKSSNPSPSSSATTTHTRPMRVMIVEDDAINRAILLKKLVKDFSHQVQQTVHGEEAVRLFQEDRNFDMILMDLQMPICDGYTATKRIRDIERQSTSTSSPGKYHPALDEVPIFAVSASLHEHQKNQLLDCGFSGFILKPVDFARLGELMRGALEVAARDHNQYQLGRWERGGWLATTPQSAPSPTPSPIID